MTRSSFTIRLAWLELSCSTIDPPWVISPGSALADPNDQNSGTASQTRSTAVRCKRIEGVGDERAVRQGHAFGRRGRARGIEDVADVLGPHLALRGSEFRGADTASLARRNRRAKTPPPSVRLAPRRPFAAPAALRCA